MLVSISTIGFGAAFSTFADDKRIRAEKIIRTITVLFVGVYLARYLGPTEYGVLNYALSFVGLFIVFSTLGLDNIMSFFGYP